MSCDRVPALIDPHFSPWGVEELMGLLNFSAFVTLRFSTRGGNAATTLHPATCN
jgi:hypothetical protein